MCPQIFFCLHVWTFVCLCDTPLCVFVKMGYLCVCVDTDSNWILMRGPPTALSHDRWGWVALQRGRHCISGRERTTLCLCCSRKQSLAWKEGNVLCVWQYSSPKYKCCNMPKQAAIEDTLFFDPGFTSWISNFIRLSLPLSHSDLRFGVFYCGYELLCST